MAEDKITEHLIVDDIKKILAREVKELKRKKDILNPVEVAALEKYSRILATVIGISKEIEKDLSKLTDEELDALAD